MLQNRQVRKWISWLSVAVLAASIIPSSVTAAQITARKLTLSTSSPAASAATTTYTFNFTVPTTGTPIKSFDVQVCDLAAGTCNIPTGFSISSATLASQPTGFGAASGWTVSTATAGRLRILNASNATNPSGSQQVVFGNVQNPTTTNKTFYGRMTTYSDSAWTTGLDTGTIAASTATQIILTGTMPESLIFCTGATISTTGGVPDCATATAGSVSFDRLFSPTDTAVALSQMAASTNAASGYNITVNGATLTSGGNTVTAMSASGVGVRGTSQFGMNLRANTVATSTPAFGTDVTPSSNGTNFRGQPLVGYAAIDNFKFVTGDSVANSGNASLGPSDAQIYTVSYIANVNGAQAAGTYTSTLTYICTATF